MQDAWARFYDLDDGIRLHELARELWPICRSLTGNGVRETLRRVATLLPNLQIHEVPSGTKCFDWVVPDEWNIREAFLVDPMGRRVVDFLDHNLHVVGYSEPVDTELSLDELRPHLHSLPESPDAIPYVTSYYQRGWGFCLRHRDLRALEPGKYHAVIDSELGPGSLTFADLVIPGETDSEVFFSTYVCHPSMANNELSGPLVATALARHVAALPRRHFTYRFYFGPETIGAIAYLSQRLRQMQEHVRAGFVITCVGDDRAYSFLPSRRGGTLADRVAEAALTSMVGDYKHYSFLDRGSDERQYCSPGVDLPVASIMRSKYGEFAEYHTSLDDLTLVTPSGLAGAVAVYKACVELLERNTYYVVSQPCEPQLGPRGLYPNVSTRMSGLTVRAMMNFLAYCDGSSDVLDIAKIIGVSPFDLLPFAERLSAEGVIREASRFRTLSVAKTST